MKINRTSAIRGSVLIVQHSFSGRSGPEYAGAISHRTTERLGATDVGVIMYRKMTEELIKAVEEGRDPINVHRDPPKNKCITLATEHTHYPGYTRTGGPFVETPLVPPQVEASLE